VAEVGPRGREFGGGNQELLRKKQKDHMGRQSGEKGAQKLREKSSRRLDENKAYKATNYRCQGDRGPQKVATSYKSRYTPKRPSAKKDGGGARKGGLP